MSKQSNQFPPDIVPTVTGKSSGLEFLKANVEPRQDSKVEGREKVTKNDKKG